MTPYQERVVKELEDLNEKRQKLTEFLEGKSMPEVLQTLPRDEINRMQRQSLAMSMYADCLAERIFAFK